jgi:hypothetical protein
MIVVTFFIGISRNVIIILHWTGIEASFTSGGGGNNL